jgi:hypothetical protein
VKGPGLSSTDSHSTADQLTLAGFFISTQNRNSPTHRLARPRPRRDPRRRSSCVAMSSRHAQKIGERESPTDEPPPDFPPPGMPPLLARDGPTRTKAADPGHEVEGKNCDCDRDRDWDQRRRRPGPETPPAFPSHLMPAALMLGPLSALSPFLDWLGTQTKQAQARSPSLAKSLDQVEAIDGGRDRRPRTTDGEEG